MSPVDVIHDNALDHGIVRVICNDGEIGTLPATRVMEWRRNSKRPIRRAEITLHAAKRVKLEPSTLPAMKELYETMRAKHPEWITDDLFSIGTTRDDICLLGIDVVQRLIQAYHEWFVKSELSTVKHAVTLALERTKTREECEALEEFLKASWVRAHDQTLSTLESVFPYEQ